jgi:hypothetical protein
MISVEKLQQITRYCDCEPTDRFVANFWMVAGRFTAEEMKRLLRFITTLTRFPNMNLNPEFRIHVARMKSAAPNQTLPTASTCFNVLYLPPYSEEQICYQKLLYAIQFCQTMDKK